MIRGSRRDLILALLLARGASVQTTIVGLHQIVTPEIQLAGVLDLSVQREHTATGNSQQLPGELGLTPRFEVAWFQGFKPGE